MINNIHNVQASQPAQNISSTQSTEENQSIPSYDQSGQQNSGQTADSSQRVGGTVSIDEIRNAVDDLNSQLEAQKIRVNFDVDEETGRIVVMVKDADSGDTLRQIPSEATLDFARNAQKGIGIRLDTTM